MPRQLTDGFSSGDDELAISILNKWTGGPLSIGLFTVLAKITPQYCIETVVMRMHNSKIQCLLVTRDSADPVWPGMIHSPGSALRAADYDRRDKNPLMGPVERVQNNEIMLKFIGDPEFVGMDYYRTRRGPEVVHIFLAQVPENSVLQSNAAWYNVEDLGSLDNFLTHQVVPIGRAAQYFSHKYT